jgi:hypothetical protein
MPTRRTVAPRDATDTFNPPSDGPVLVHDEATVQHYRQAAEKARRHGPSRTIPAQVTAEPPASGPPLPFIGVAEQVRGTKLRELEAAMVRLERELAQGSTGAGGQPLSSFPGLLAMRREKEQALVFLAGEIEQLRGLEGDALRQWAFDQGHR